MKTDCNNEPVEVFDGTIWQAGIMKSLLENSEMKAYLRDEILGTLSPWWTAPGEAGSVKVFVSDLDHDNSRIIVEEYEKNIKENS